MDRKTNLILIVISLSLYVLVVWVLDLFGPGMDLFLSVVFLILMIYLGGNVKSNKKQKKQNTRKKK